MAIVRKDAACTRRIDRKGLRRLIRGDIRLPKAERNALKYMVEKMVALGFELQERDSAVLKPVIDTSNVDRIK
jgi:hypothetical protein